MVGALVAVVLIAVAVYDWTRPCTGGPLTQAVKTLLNGGTYTVRCAG